MVCLGWLDNEYYNIIINHLYFCNIYDVNEDDEINNENFEEDIILNQ